MRKFNIGDRVIVDRRKGIVWNYTTIQSGKFHYQVRFGSRIDDVHWYDEKYIMDDSLDNIMMDSTTTITKLQKMADQALNNFYGAHPERRIKKVIFNNPATIVMWGDNTKTIVKTQDGEDFDPEKGLAMAISKKFLGNRGNYYNTFKEWLPEKEKRVVGFDMGKEFTFSFNVDPNQFVTLIGGLKRRRKMNKNKISVLYLCDREACDYCKEECKHTSNINHAINFYKLDSTDGYLGEILDD